MAVFALEHLQGEEQPPPPLPAPFVGAPPQQSPLAGDHALPVVGPQEEDDQLGIVGFGHLLHFSGPVEVVGPGQAGGDPVGSGHVDQIPNPAAVQGEAQVGGLAVPGHVDPQRRLRSDRSTHRDRGRIGGFRARRVGAGRTGAGWVCSNGIDAGRSDDRLIAAPGLSGDGLTVISGIGAGGRFTSPGFGGNRLIAAPGLDGDGLTVISGIGAGRVADRQLVGPVEAGRIGDRRIAAIGIRGRVGDGRIGRRRRGG